MVCSIQSRDQWDLTEGGGSSFPWRFVGLTQEWERNWETAGRCRASFVRNGWNFPLLGQNCVCFPGHSGDCGGGWEGTPGLCTRVQDRPVLFNVSPFLGIGLIISSFVFPRNSAPWWRLDSDTGVLFELDPLWTVWPLNESWGSLERKTAYLFLLLVGRMPLFCFRSFSFIFARERLFIQHSNVWSAN